MNNNQQVHELLQCSICCNAFNSGDHIPKVLQCGHAMCLNCLQTILGSLQKQCPTCKKGVDNQNINDFPTLFMLIPNVDQVQYNSKFSLNQIKCSKSTLLNSHLSVKFYCKICNEFLCQACQDQHQVFAQRSKHQIVDVQEGLSIINQQLASLLYQSEKTHTDLMQEMKNIQLEQKDIIATSEGAVCALNKNRKQVIKMIKKFFEQTQEQIIFKSDKMAQMLQTQKQQIIYKSENQKTLQRQLEQRIHQIVSQNQYLFDAKIILEEIETLQEKQKISQIFDGAEEELDLAKLSQAKDMIRQYPDGKSFDNIMTTIENSLKSNYDTSLLSEMIQKGFFNIKKTRENQDQSEIQINKDSEIRNMRSTQKGRGQSSKGKKRDQKQQEKMQRKEKKESLIENQTPQRLLNQDKNLNKSNQEEEIVQIANQKGQKIWNIECSVNRPNKSSSSKQTKFQIDNDRQNLKRKTRSSPIQESLYEEEKIQQDAQQNINEVQESQREKEDMNSALKNGKSASKQIYSQNLAKTRIMTDSTAVTENQNAEQLQDQRGRRIQNIQDLEEEKVPLNRNQDTEEVPLRTRLMFDNLNEVGQERIQQRKRFDNSISAKFIIGNDDQQVLQFNPRKIDSNPWSISNWSSNYSRERFRSGLIKSNSACCIYPKKPNEMLITGGQNQNVCVLVKFDQQTNSTQVEMLDYQMNQERQNHQLIYCNNSFYAIGGDNLKSVEELQPLQGNLELHNNYWQKVPSMATVIHDVFIYVFGSGGMSEFSTRIEYYNTNLRKWDYHSCVLPKAFCFIGAVSFKFEQYNQVLVLGIVQDFKNNDKTSIYRFNVDKKLQLIDQKEKALLNMRRIRHNIFVTDSKLFVLGGKNDGGSYLDLTDQRAKFKELPSYKKLTQHSIEMSPMGLFPSTD
ncbi:kelch motif family protein [Stylonychia lemnae]|uniref:Kelch motif family protein n=1 Tax=Stylonychia lemnae TaxID=5949 RepID=A0A078AG23_STYLE|nr:kelch motif family protein [Stylonychia lemnae]|eukprot:CDW81265.1 kelch motif family protein [Stylonychia lemnae]